MKALSILVLPILLLTSCDKGQIASAEESENMAWIPGGRFKMGASEEGGYLMAQPTNEGPVHAAEVDGFWLDKTEVTNAQFREFVDATDYKTIAETPFKQEDYPLAPPEALVPAGYIFFQSETP
ncbi:MAG: sulfatase modifying factor 1, partial [Verrucomicrobiales bacterium]